MHKKINIKDIARECGVGLGTVSRIINSKPGVKDEIRRKVLQYIEDIGWRSNSIENRLKLIAPEKTIVFIASTSLLERKYDHDLLRILLEKTIVTDYSPLTLFGQCRENLERCAISKPYAVIIAGANSFQKDPVGKILKNGTKVISIGDCDDYIGPMFFSNYHNTTIRATKMLMKAGHKKIAFLGGIGMLKQIEKLQQINLPTIRKMIQGIIDTNPDFNISEDVLSDCFSNLSHLEDVLQSKAHSAWICSDEKMCRQLLHCAGKLKINVPEDISVIGITPDLPFYSFDVDLTRFYPDNNTIANQIIESLQASTIVEPTSFSFECLYHKGNTVKSP